MFKKIYEEARKIVPSGVVDVKVLFEGEFAFETPLEDGTTGYNGYYTAEIRFDENGEVVPLYTCVRSFTTDEGEQFDPGIPFSEMDVFDYYGFEIVEIRGYVMKFTVKNAGFYGYNEDGTWNEMMEEIGAKVPGWSTYDVTKHSWIGGRKHYWGELLDGNSNIVYTFYAVFDSQKGEIEVHKI